jgi:hypothetical protein
VNARAILLPSGLNLTAAIESKFKSLNYLAHLITPAFEINTAIAFGRYDPETIPESQLSPPTMKFPD